MRTPPNSTISHESVEDGEQLSHARHQTHLLGLAGREQPLIELPDHRIEPSGDESFHIERRPHWSSPSPHLPLAPTVSGVAVEGGDAHQVAQALVGESPQFRQLGQESAGEDWADTGDAFEQCLVLLEGSGDLDGLVKVCLSARDLCLEPLDELTSSGEDALQSHGFLVGDYAGSGLHCGGESGEDESVYPVGLSEASHSLGEVPRLTGIDDRDRDPGGRDGGGGEALVSSGGLQNDQLNSGLTSSSRERSSSTPS